MSSSVAKDKRKRGLGGLGRTSSRLHVSVSGPQSILWSPSRRSFSPGAAGSKVLDKNPAKTPRQAVRVFDEEGNDVTPRPLYQADPGTTQSKASRFLVDEMSAGSVSEQTTVTGSFALPFSRSLLGSSRTSSQSTIESMKENFEDTFFKRDLPISFPDIGAKRERMKEQVTEDMLDEMVDILITMSDTITLLDLPSTVVSVDADDADAVIEQNKRYAEICRTRPGNEKYVDGFTQTLNGAPKNKQVQTDGVAMKDSATSVTTWDMYDTFFSPEQGGDRKESAELETPDFPTTVVDSKKSVEKSMSLASTASSVSAPSSLKEVESCGNFPNTDSELQLIMSSEAFQHSLLVMERSVLLNNFQPVLAAYRGLPVIEDPYSALQPETVDQREDDREESPTPALEFLWVYSCELTRGRSVRSMAWNKKDLDILAVGYGDTASGGQSPGLACCWTIKNIVWPERVVHCDSAVTSLDFSAQNPCELAVGMKNGDIEIHHVHNKEKTRAFSSRDCPIRNMDVVHQLVYNQQDLSLKGEEKTESLFSVGNDGRVCKWTVVNKGLDCMDLMMIKWKKPGVKKTEEKSQSVLSLLSPGLCLDFHPADSNIYLIGTSEGLIHKCCCSDSQQFLDTYKKHLHSVNCVTWSPFSPSVFLSCSSDWTVQLWKQDQRTPVFRFSSSRKPVRDVQWSPKWATVFGSVSEGQLDIWDLSVSTVDPILVQPAAPGVRMTSLLFASQTDCVVVGDSDGGVSVYLLKNVHKEEGSQVDVLNDLLHSTVRKQPY